MKKSIFKGTLSIACSILLLIGCNDSEEEITLEPVPVKGKVSLGVNIPNSGSDRIAQEPIPTSILISIKDSEGQVVFNLEELTLVEVNGAYISSIIELDTGTYTVEDFIITDANDTSIYITPKTGSEFAKLVSTPLPYKFSVIADEVKKVELDVIPSTLGQASDFGYAEFTFNVIDLEAGLIAYYPFDGNANDESGNSLNGTIEGAQLTTDRHDTVNSAFLFSNDLDVITVNDNDLLDITSELTISAWIKLTSGNINGSRIVDKIISGTGQGFLLDLYNPSNNSSEITNTIRFIGQEGLTNITQQEVKTGEWTHILSSYKAGLVRIYINGTLVSETTESTNELLVNSEDLQIGNNIYGSGSLLYSPFRGKIDDVRIYNRALTSAEVKVLSK